MISLQLPSFQHLLKQNLTYCFHTNHLILRLEHIFSIFLNMGQKIYKARFIGSNLLCNTFSNKACWNSNLEENILNNVQERSYWVTILWAYTYLLCEREPSVGEWCSLLDVSQHQWPRGHNCRLLNQHLYWQFFVTFFLQKIYTQTARTEKFGRVACEMLMTLTQTVNLSNILQASYAPFFFFQKLQSQTVIREKLLVKCC